MDINLIDTPGHTDFSAEIERPLRALEEAIMVVSAVEGVQPQTELLFEVPREQGLPTLFFINKTDREGACMPRVPAQILRRLSPRAALAGEAEQVLEAVCDADDAVMECWIYMPLFAHAPASGRSSACLHSQGKQNDM